jgi:Na+/melibiose symporter-like transporter
VTPVVIDLEAERAKRRLPFLLWSAVALALGVAAAFIVKRVRGN